MSSPSNSLLSWWSLMRIYLDFLSPNLFFSMQTIIETFIHFTSFLLTHLIEMMPDSLQLLN